MKIAFINTIKPQKDSGDGETEIAYRLYEALKGKHEIDLIYPIEKSKRNDLFGLVYANTLFKKRLREKLREKKYNIIHIVNEEMGYAARIAKEAQPHAKVIISIYSLLRLRPGYHKGFFQKGYNGLVSKGLYEARDYVDLMILCGVTVEKQAEKLFGKIRKKKEIYIGPPRETLMNAPTPKKKHHKTFNVGYVAALNQWKNTIFVLRTAKLLRDKPFKFSIYGTGVLMDYLKDYKEKNRLDNVEFMGFAYADKFLDIFDSFDAFFYPTLEEGTSEPILNALVRGLPVIVYRKTNLTQEVVKPSIIANDESDAARILEGLRTKGYDDKRRLANIKYARGFSWSMVIRETLDAYRRVLKS